MMTLEEAKDRLFEVKAEIESLENQLDRTRRVADIHAIHRDLRQLNCKKIKYETIIERLEKNGNEQRCD